VVSEFHKGLIECSEKLQLLKGEARVSDQKKKGESGES